MRRFQCENLCLIVFIAILASFDAILASIDVGGWILMLKSRLNLLRVQMFQFVYLIQVNVKFNVNYY